MPVEVLPDPDVSFTVYGVAAPKGSKSAFPVKRKGGGLGVAVREGKSDRAKDWAHRVEEVVQDLAAHGAPLLDEPLELRAEFVLPRPKSAPKRRMLPDRKPDLDKLLRALLDPMTGVLIADDARIVTIEARKNYAAPGDRPHATVRVRPAAEFTWGDGEAADVDLSRTEADVEVPS